MNLIVARPQTFELFAAPGCLEEAALEVQSILNAPWKPLKFVPRLDLQKGFVRLYNCSWDTACEIAARASTLHDLRLTFPAAKITGWNDLPRLLEKLPWGMLLPESEDLEFRAEAFGILPHAARIAEMAAEVFARHGFTSTESEPHTRIHLTSSAEYLRVAVSLGNDALHKRGWRASAGTPATLREDLASAALLRLATFEPAVRQASQIAVPFAGSGTLGLEAWQSLFGLPPAIWGTQRPWQRLTMPSIATQAWWTKRIARAIEGLHLPPIVFVENDAKQMRELEGNVAKVQRTVQGSLKVLEADAFSTDFLTKDGINLLPLHPPYGLRLESENPTALFAQLGAQLAAWQQGHRIVGFCLCPTEETWLAFKAGLEGMRVSTSHITQGGLDVRLCCFSNL